MRASLDFNIYARVRGRWCVNIEAVFFPTIRIFMWRNIHLDLRDWNCFRRFSSKSKNATFRSEVLDGAHKCVLSLQTWHFHRFLMMLVEKRSEFVVWHVCVLVLVGWRKNEVDKIGNLWGKWLRRKEKKKGRGASNDIGSIRSHLKEKIKHLQDTSPTSCSFTLRLTSP